MNALLSTHSFNNSHGDNYSYTYSSTYSPH